MALPLSLPFSVVLCVLLYATLSSGLTQGKPSSSAVTEATCCECRAVDSPAPFFVNAGGLSRLDCVKACQEHKTCPGK